MSRYIVCVDGSVNSTAAVYMTKRCSKAGDSIELIAAVKTSRKLLTNAERTAKAEHNLAEAAAKLSEKSVTSRIVESPHRNPAAALLEACEGHCDVIVVGTRGLGVIARTFMGSVSSTLLSTCRQSAILVTPNNNFLPDGPIRCLCMNDGSAPALQCVKLLAKLLSASDSVCFFACQPETTSANHAGQLKTRGEMGCYQATEQFHECGGKAQITEQYVVSSQPAAAALKYADKAGDVTYIAVGARGLNAFDRFYLGSTTRTLIDSGKYPVLVMTYSP